MTPLPERPAPDQTLQEDLQPILDEELSQLPDKYRVALVLCDLEGRTRKEVARQLQVPEGTIASRLATARQRLAARLTRRGVTVSSAGVGTLLAGQSASACVPATVIASTLQTTISLATGQTMTELVTPAVAALLTEAKRAILMTRIKCVAAALLATGLLCGAVAFGAGLLSDPGKTADKTEPKYQPPEANKDVGVKPGPGGTKVDKAPTKEQVVEDFIRAMLTEDQAALDKLCAGRVQADFRAYFWLRKSIHGAQKPRKRAVGKIKVEAAGRESVLSTEAELTQGKADFFTVTVQGKRFRVGLDEKDQVIVVCDAK